MKEHDSDIKELKKKVNELEQERKTDETAQIKTELNKLEQYGRMNNLEVHGLAETPNENLLDKLNTIADKIQAPRLTKDNVEAVHRVPNKAKKVPMVIVRFVNRNDRNMWLQIKQKLRREASADNVYLQENMTASNRKLFYDVRMKAKYLGYKFVWHKEGISYRPIVHSLTADDDFDIIQSASLKPFQKLRCINTLITPKFLYAASSILGSAGESAGVDKRLRTRIKSVLHLPQSFPSTHVYLPSRDGGLGVMNIERVGSEVQLKALARLVRLGNLAVDSLFNSTIGAFHCRLASQLQVPADFTDAEELSAALRHSRTIWWGEHRAVYANKDLFSHHGQPLSNTWLQPDTHHLKDGDRIKALRLRTNILPTNALLQRHNTDASSRLCRRCRHALETPFHILQECPSIKLPRMERHNFLCKQRGGDRLKPDIVVTIDDTVVIADVAVAWNDRPASLSRMCAFKSAKYDCLRPLFPGKVTTAVGLAFGARSMLCKETLSGGASLGIPKWDMAWLSSRALVGSLICFNRFMKS
ncbi:hypothetical protein HPB47_013632 [Ixodes persulcatus]|uniref:Uncharacterized protein n=1 Tax=Ixodes persulcatus TaxID=34615 RepID=A0AC60R0W6_IXOPE|nr:hypothetical protein HPB47_013632 [Ixodes persulcatus]